MRFVRYFATNEDDVFAAELVIGEVLANTVAHAPGLFELHVDSTPEEPLLTIRDCGPGFKA